MTRTTTIVGVLTLVGGLVAARAADGPPAPHHLVGHEDAALLARVQDVIDDWDPRKLVNPLVEASEAAGPDGKVVVRKQLRRPDLAEFVADVDAMEALGKAFFWDMQAGSDFRRTAENTYVGTACASCHYRHGADARTRYATRVPYVVWNKYTLDPAHKPLEYGEAQRPFDVVVESARQYKPAQYSPAGPFALIVGSAGVEPRIFDGVRPDPGAGPWEAEKSRKRPLVGFAELPHWAMFVAGNIDGGKRFRQLTTRNAPTVFNSAFADRLFHDGRAESTFNGFSIFGDADRREVIHKAVITTDAAGTEVYREPVPVHVAVTRAALASQAVGPVVNDVEMSYLGRTFPNLAYRLLQATPLKYQAVADGDSILGRWKAGGAVGPAAAGKYRDLIQRAFRREWWDGRSAADGKTQYPVPLVLMRDDCDGRTPRGELMEANFSLYWGLSVMFYQATLVSNRSPFDDMMRGRPEAVNRRWEQVKAQFGQVKVDSVPREKARVHPNGASVFQHGFRVFLTRGCMDCHGGPLFSDAADRRPEHEPFPIQARVDRTLLPVSQAEAIALKYQAARADALADVARLVTSGGVTTKARAAAVAVHLDALREEARGDRDRLTGLVGKHLDLSTAAQTPRRIADRLLLFEKTVAGRFGDRAFFGEDARIAAAEALVGGVRVEKMAIPNGQVKHRPELPIGGLRASAPYAFYDGGFYNLGVSPPRYDRGVGARVGIPDPEEAIDTVIAQLRFPEKELDDAGKKRLADAVRYKAAPAAQRAALGKEAPELVQQVEKARANAASRSATASAPGRAYRFDRHWARPRAPSEEPAGPPRKTDEGPPPDCDPDRDGKAIAGGRDTSWDREELPDDARRADLFFLSRARRLVTTEDPWGFRKPFLHDHELAFWGAFRVPTLRNVELTAPYMHNGRLMSLHDVVDFYERDEELNPVRFLERDRTLNPDVHPQMVRLNLTRDDKLALVFFMMCLTDERVRTSAAPFDHPGLRLVHGYAPDGSEIDELISPGPVP